MPIAHLAHGIDCYHEVDGPDDGPPVLMIMGLGAQMIAWPPELVEGLVARGMRVIRFDNRDVGLSTKIDAPPPSPAEAAAGRAPYTLSDMAADAVGLLDHLGIDAAHVVGASMGGMIAQTVAIEHPGRVRSLTSIMSTTGEPEVGQPEPDALARLMTPPPADREGAIEHSVLTSQVISGPLFDPERARQRAAAAYDRCFHPAGVARQLAAILASGSRAEGLRRLRTPTLVIHGAVDPLVTPSGGRRTAELVPGARLVIYDEMGHDLPVALVDRIVDEIAAHVAAAEAARA